MILDDLPTRVLADEIAARIGALNRRGFALRVTSMAGAGTPANFMGEGPLGDDGRGAAVAVHSQRRTGALPTSPTFAAPRRLSLSDEDAAHGAGPCSSPEAGSAPPSEKH